MSKISRDLQNPDKYDITFTDKIQVNTVVREYIKNIEETLVINETKDRTIINRDAVRRAAQRIDILRDDVRSLVDRKSTRLNSSHSAKSRMPSSA